MKFQLNPETKPSAYFIEKNGFFPNNHQLPVLIYKNVFESEDNLPEMMEKLFLHNHWSDSWRNGIYDYHHYHSTAHEVLGIFSGYVHVQLGGPEGLIFSLQKGDVILIPVGVAHKNAGSSTDFKCVGAYPEGQKYDMQYGKEDEFGIAQENIFNTPLPKTDPVYGREGLLVR